MEIRAAYLWHAALILNLKAKGGAQALDMSAYKDAHIRASQSIHISQVWNVHPSWQNLKHILSERL